jgi:lipopolysaccharide biosynthesis glycosyltransferase
MKIFIGFDNNEKEAAKVCEYSLRKSSPKKLDITLLNINELNFNRPLDPLQSSEFTYTRFLVPFLCNYEGAALFLDSDMLVISDINELFDLYDSRYALQVVKHDHVPLEITKKGNKIQSAYLRKNWSSLMLMNCSELKLWSKGYVEKASGSELHQFVGIDDFKIGDITKEWNTLDILSHNTKILHYTSGGPWIKGCENHPESFLWLDYWKNMYQDGIKNVLSAYDWNNIENNCFMNWCENKRLQEIAPEKISFVEFVRETLNNLL